MNLCYQPLQYLTNKWQWCVFYRVVQHMLFYCDIVHSNCSIPCWNGSYYNGDGMLQIFSRILYRDNIKIMFKSIRVLIDRSWFKFSVTSKEHTIFKWRSTHLYSGCMISCILCCYQTPSLSIFQGAWTYIWTYSPHQPMTGLTQVVPFKHQDYISISLWRYVMYVLSAFS